MEGQAEDLDMEVNGIAGQIALGPAPVTVFDHKDQEFTVKDARNVRSSTIGSSVTASAADRLPA